MKPWCSIIAGAALFAAATSVHGQRGTADLRYREPVPATIMFETIDSTTTTMQSPEPGGGEHTTRQFSRLVLELGYVPADGGLDVTIVQLAGELAVETPAGLIQSPLPAIAPGTVRFTGSGPDGGGGSASPMGGVPFLRLPGRTLQLGETWADTVARSFQMFGMPADMRVEVHGTYAADTVIDGRLLNVLRITSVETVRSRNEMMERTPMSQNSTKTTQVLVLWDSDRHHVSFSEAEGETYGEVTARGQASSMVFTGRTHSITTAQPKQ
jgi:hypothetical protein